MGEKVNKQKINTDSILVFVFAIGIMISPDTFALLGGFIGKTGVVGFPLIILSVIFYLILLSQYRQLPVFQSSNLYGIGTLKTTIGSITAIFPFFVKMIVVIFLSTGLLVSSGFVFNEVFLYWFPNFGFAFILLGILFVLQLLPVRAALYSQIVFCGIVISGFLILIISGITQADHFNAFKPENVSYFSDIPGINLFFLPLLLFIGFDLGIDIVSKSDKNILQGKILFSAIVFMGIIFILWGYVSLLYVPVEKLVETSIPHIIAAKNILGAQGRFIMGIIIIAGSLAAVNALFTNISEHGSMLLEKKMLPGGGKISKIIILFLSLIIAGAMAGGLAGALELETFIRASLILWLILYTIILIAYIIFLKRLAKENKSANWFLKIISLISLLILGISILILILMDDKPILILKFLGVSLLICFIPSILYILKNNPALKRLE
jgi:amino acid transporter